MSNAVDKIVPCPHCGAKNRLGNPPAGQVPVCGACKKPLPWLVEANSGLTSELEASVPVLVDFWAEWCQPCRMLTPTIEKVADRFAGKAKVGKMNTDFAQQTAVKYGINAIPTVILFNKGQVVQKFVGVQQEAAYAGAIEAATK